MSRIEKNNSEYGMAYGNDHACGYFIQVWDKKSPDEMLISKDGLFDGLTLNGVVNIADDYGFDLTDEIPNGDIHY